MIYLYLFGTCFHFIYVFMIIANNLFKPSIFNFQFNHARILKIIMYFCHIIRAIYGNIRYSTSKT